MLHTSNFANRVDVKYFNHIQKKGITIEKRGQEETLGGNE